ncbi:putative C-type lectin domain family 20 member A [Acipenser ruthenus]|uniref:putative C-type lectin domain family 20 member A n=1 Tax=Acipenser ruthenus TaxID=7906 RepID=UPI00274064F8|nr:putative C-type lectin domain family 20 member A [Acipenser ruthenus]
MGERGLLILLLAGFCVPAYNQIIKHVFVNTLKSWSAAQSYCRKNHTDLATVHSQEEAQQLLNIAGASLNTSAWIGLYRDGTQNWQWSNGDDVIYKSWTKDLFCASINSVGQWEDSVCFETKAFMCYQETSTITERYTLIQELKTWTEAQQYCRKYHTDLVSIKNTSENADLVKKAQGKTFWIGLFNDPWKWSHQGDNYTFHYWNNEEPNNAGGNDKCVRMFKSGTWGDKDCSVLYPFFCYDDPAPSDPPSTRLSEDPAPSDPPSTRLSEDPTPSDPPTTPLSEDPKTTSPPSTPVPQEAEPSSPPSTPVSQDLTPSDPPSTTLSEDATPSDSPSTTLSEGMESNPGVS